jgi:predicted Zn-dependent protease
VPALVTSRGEDAVRLYRTLKAQQPPAYTFLEDDINRLGYALLARDRTDDAIAILALNVEEHPDSWNAYDSLGEAYGTAGKKELAIAK